MSEENGDNGISYIFIAFIIIFSVLLATGASYFMLVKFGALGGGEEETEATEEKEVKKLGPTTNLETFTVNLSSSRSFAQINIVLEVSEQPVIQEIGNRSPQIRDTIITILRNQKATDLESSDGSRKLREEIRKEVNKKLTKGTITNVFFTKFVIQ